MALPTAADIIPAEPAQVPANSEAVSDAEVSIPDEVLEIPAVYGLLHGNPAAIYADLKTTNPELEVIGKHAPELGAAGMGFYKSKDGTLGVLYNSAYVDEATLRAADGRGAIQEVAAPYEEVQARFNGAVGQSPAGPAASVVPSPTATGSPPSSKTQQKVAGARLKNLQLGSPTSGPVPGQGRIANSILKPVI